MRGKDGEKKKTEAYFLKNWTWPIFYVCSLCGRSSFNRSTISTRRGGGEVEDMYPKLYFIAQNFDV